MEGNETAAHFTVRNSIQALGRGFDANNDNRLLYCKGVSGPRLLNSDHHVVSRTKDLQLVDDGLIVSNVPNDVFCFPESSRHVSTGVCEFNQMAEIFNDRARITGRVPIGSFNSAFSFTGAKQTDASSTKTLAIEGIVVPLCRVELIGSSSWSLRGDAKRAVPACWDPCSLASFIESYGTHIVMSITIGGKDLIYIKQQSSSSLSKTQIKSYIEDVRNQRFSDIGKIPMKSKDSDLTVIFRRRGGDDLVQNHSQWKHTIREAPDVIDMAFLSITSLLDNVPGKEHLTRAISLYLEYKPPIEELRYFLEFQIPKIWAPVGGQIPGHPRKQPVCPFLQFSIMGPKLYVSQDQISVGRKPVTALRLTLEGPRDNRLSIHVRHLALLPKILQPYWDTHVAIGAPKWHGPEEQDSRWFVAVKWNNFSHVSTAPIENHGSIIGDLSSVHVVTGAQLGVWDFGAKSVLYMRLLYSRLPGCTIRRSFWDHNPTTTNYLLNDEEMRLLSSDSNSGVSSSSSTSGEIARKLLKHVDLSEMGMGPKDSPGHWLVTGGKLGVEKGKIFLRVKYSLLNY